MKIRVRDCGRLLLASIALVLAGSMAVGETITVTHWGAQFYGAPYAVAREKGFFKKHGVDITGFLTSAGGGTSVRNTLAGDVPYGEVALPAAILAINSGLPLKIINGGVDTVADILWITQNDSPMKGLKDIAGHKVAFTSPGSVTNMIILMCMKHAGIDPKDVKLVPAGDVGANYAAVVNRAVDAAMNGEPLWTANQGKVKPLFWASECVGDNMTQTVGVTTSEFAAANPDKLKAIIAARREGVEYINAHPEEAADIVAKAYDQDAKLFREVFKHFVQIKYWGNGDINLAGMNRMIEGMLVVGSLKAAPDWSKIVDSSFLPKN